MFQPVGGDAGFSQANGPDARPPPDPPQPARATSNAAATATGTRPTVTRVRRIAQTPPSPSSGPPLLSASPSPPLFCGMPLLAGVAGFGAGGAGFGADFGACWGTGFGAGWGFAAGGAAGRA